MRISTALIFDSGVFGMQRNQSELAKFMEHLSTGRRILTPKDDAVAAAESLKVTQANEVNNQYLTNQASAGTALNELDNNMANLTDELQNILKKTIQVPAMGLTARNSGDDRRRTPAALREHPVHRQYAECQRWIHLLRDENPGPAFSSDRQRGHYDLTNLYVGYQGDAGPREVQANASQTVDTAVDGQTAVHAGARRHGNGHGPWSLRLPPEHHRHPRPHQRRAFHHGFRYPGRGGSPRSHRPRVARARECRRPVQALDSMTALGEDQNLQYEQRLSKLQDLDYAEAISKLTQQQVQLQAAQLSFKQINQLSLFNIL